MAQAKIQNFSFQVHDSGDRTLDGIFRLIAIAEREAPLEEILTGMCGDIAAIAHADVASVYVREDVPEAETAAAMGETPGTAGTAMPTAMPTAMAMVTEGVEQRFTMRGNVGFPADAVGRVHLHLGEGITGFAAARLRPVSVAMADRDEHFKYIPGLGEERFPSLLAVPILRGGIAAGVLVLQRSEPVAFTDGEVVMASAVAAVLNHALERGRERDRRKAEEDERRSVHLVGKMVVAGSAMGHAEILPTLAALSRTSHLRRPVSPADLDGIVRRLETKLARAMLAARGPAAVEMKSLALILDDERFRSRLGEACAAAVPLKALSEMARAYARAPYDAPPAESGEQRAADSAQLMGDRAAEIEDLCVLIYAGSSGARPLVRPGAVVVSEKLRLFSTAHAIDAGAAAFVVDGEVSDGAAAAMVRTAGLPLLSGVRGVFSWLRPEDLLVVDAEAGILQVNPPATAVARLRNARR